MPKFNVAVPNPLSKEDALERLQGFSEKLREKYEDQISDLEQSWDGDQVTFGFATYGMKIAGKGSVGEDEVRIEGDLPFAAAMFKGKIVSTVEEQLKRLLG